MKANPWVVVIDDDGLNAYGSEICRVLNNLEYDVRFYKRFHGPNDLQSAFLSKRATARLRTSTSNLNNFWYSFDFYRSLLRNPLVVICWASTKQKMFLIVFSIFVPLRMIYVVHNPVPNRIPVGWKDKLERIFMRKSTAVVHGKSLQRSFERIYEYKPLVAMHPPYMGAVNYMKSKKIIRGQVPRKKILLLGRRAKNETFPILDYIDSLSSKVSNFELIVAQRPRTEFDSGGGKIVNLTSDSPMSESSLLDLILDCDLVLSPSVNVSESGTVILANSLGINVVAFDSPELRKHLKPFALVAPFDVAGLVDASFDLLTNPDLASAQWGYADWMEETCSSWRKVLDSYSTRDRR